MMFRIENQNGYSYGLALVNRNNETLREEFTNWTSDLKVTEKHGETTVIIQEQSPKFIKEVRKKLNINNDKTITKILEKYFESYSNISFEDFINNIKITDDTDLYQYTHNNTEKVDYIFYNDKIIIFNYNELEV